ncbi:glycosyl transferase [Vibrio crassostreae 9CS106]|nr:glycosyl transferase [Vibrio crassostreae 9CS106]
MKKIAVIGTVGIPACYGGFESLVENLTHYKTRSVHYSVFCSSKSYSKGKTVHNNSDLIYLPLNANGVQSVPYDILSMVKCWTLKPDTILILGVSGCLFLPIFKLFSSSRIITNIDGLEWKRDKWGKLAKKFLKISEASAVKYSDVIVTDNKAIGDYVSSEYRKDNITIAYGGDHAIRDVDDISYKGDGYALGLCRVEPENNIHIILEAFASTEMNIKFIGNWNSSQFGIDLREHYSQYKNIELIDPIYDLDELYNLRRNCSVYLHGHSAGGTNPSLVEMMHFCVPIFAYDCDFNRYSTEHRANYFSDPKDLVGLLQRLPQAALKRNAEAMYEIAVRRYTWEEITRLYESIY